MSGHTGHSVFSLKDVFFAIFRHKWLVLICTLAGLALAGYFYFFYPKTYQSSAKLLVRYVVERSAVDSVDSNTSTSSRNADTVIAAEVEILSSWDLAVQVADVVGPKRLIPKSKEPPSKEWAAGVITQGLNVYSRRGSNIIFVSYTNPDPQLATIVLDELIRQYFNKHLEVHRSAGAFDFVSQQIDRVKARLGQTEDALTPLKGKLGIISLADSKTELGAELAKTHDRLHDAEAELAEQEARVEEIEQAQTGGASSTSMKARPSPSAGLSRSTASSAPTSAAPASQGDLQKYEALVARLAQLRRTEAGLLSRYTPGNDQVQRNRAQLNEVERQKLDLETKFPDLPSRLPAASRESNPGSVDLGSERARLAGLQAKVAALKTQLEVVQDRMKQLSELSPQISELERQKELEESNYKYFEGTLEKARVDEALDPSKIPNISTVQKASPPIEVIGTRNNLALGFASGGLALGLALAILRGLLLDRSLKRPVEIEQELQTSLLLSIPYRDAKHATASLYSPPGVGSPALRANKGEIAPWEPNHFIRTYCESLRDRIGLYFELNQLTHKPKLVGVTSFSGGAGTSTLAAGLAAALSETGEGKVLLVDVNLGPEHVHPFFKGRPAYSLKTALSGSETIDPAAENLYLAKVASPQAGPAQLGLKKFFDLIPNLKASEFDYVIFDMPHLEQTSPSWGMAPFMDKLLLIVEAEKTHRAIISRGYRKLMSERTNVSVVFNKARTYLPRLLDGEYDH
jgi:uncharacterized protein involved in exopolysaccharide biosynthesis/Mrp family chromosome partitioning ATPase